MWETGVVDLRINNNTIIYSFKLILLKQTSLNIGKTVKIFFKKWNNCYKKENLRLDLFMT